MEKRVIVNLNVKTHDIWKAIGKNSKKIKGLRGAIVGLAAAGIVFALELAERKRSEVYLLEKIEKLEAKLDGSDEDRDNISESDEKAEGEDNGGAADA